MKRYVLGNVSVEVADDYSGTIVVNGRVICGDGEYTNQDDCDEWSGENIYVLQGGNCDYDDDDDWDEENRSRYEEEERERQEQEEILWAALAEYLSD